MTARDVLSEVAAARGTLVVDAARLRFRGPRAALTPALRAQLAEHQAELIELLRAEAAKPVPPALHTSRPSLVIVNAGATEHDADEALDAILARNPIGLLVPKHGDDVARHPPPVLYVGPSTEQAFAFFLRELDPEYLAALAGRLSQKTVVTHDGAQALAQLALHHKVHPAGIIDTKIAAKIVDAGRTAREDLFRFERCVERELGIHVPDVESWKLRGQIYDCSRWTSLLLPLWTALEQRLVAEQLAEAAALEFEALSVVVGMIEAGIKVNCDEWRELVHSEERAAEALRERVERELDAPGLRQPHVLAALRARGIAVEDTSKEVLEPHAADPVVRDLIELRRAEAFVGGNGKPIAVALMHSPDGRVRGRLESFGASTGRFTCVRPNLLGLPKLARVRRCFAPAEGSAFIVADYVASQLRIVAAHVNERRLIETFDKSPPDDDPHRLTACLLLEKDACHVTDAERERAKAANYGLLFGMGLEGFLAYAYSSYGLILTPEEGSIWREGFFAAYPAIADWHRKTAETRFGMPVSGSGRVRYFADGEKRFGSRLAFPIQGTEADALKRAMIRLAPILAPHGARLVLCIHDELVIEAPCDVAFELAPVVAREMCAAMEEFVKGVRVRVSVSVRTTWSSADTLSPPR